MLWEDNSAGSSASSHASISLNTSGQLVYTGDSSNAPSILGTGTHVLTPNQWYEININYNGGSASLGELIVDVDGERDITLTGIDTNNFTPPIARWMFGSTQAGNDYYFDNIFLNDTTTQEDASVYNTDRLNTKAIPYGNTLQFLLPNGEGSSLQWTPAPPASGSIHYLNVNQIPVQIGTPVTSITKINTSGLNNIDLFDIEDLPSSSGIRQIHVFSVSSHASTARHKRMIRANGTNYVSQFDSNSVASSLVVRNDLWYVNPDDNKLWEKSDIDGLQIGAKTTAATGTFLNTISDMNLYVEHYEKPFALLDLFIEGSTPSSGQIFVSNIDHIVSADLDGSNSSVIIRDGDNNLEIMGTDYIDIDTINNKLFVMLLGLPSLCRMSELDGTLLENVTLPQSLNGLTPSLAIDNSSTIVITNNGKTITGPRVFVADYSNQRIGVGNIVKQKDLTSSNFFTSIVINSFINLTNPPVAVKYDKENNLLFWTEEEGGLGKIRRSDVNGSTKIIAFNINPRSLAIDPIRRKVYRSGYDYVNGQIVQGLIQSDYDGLNRKFIIIGDTFTFAGLGLDVRLNNLYYLLSSDNKLRYQNVAPGSVSSLILDVSDQLDDPRDVKVHLFESASANIQSISRQKSLFINGSVGGVHLIITPPPIPPPPPPIPPPDPGTPPSPVTPPPDPEIIPPPTILPLFIAAPEFIEQGMDLFIGSPQIDNYLGLYIGGPAKKTGLINLFIKVQEGISANKDLYVYGKDLKIENLDLFIYGKNSIIDNINLFILGYDTTPIYIINSFSDLFIYGIDNFSNNLDLFIDGSIIQNKNLDLFTYGFDQIDNQINLFIGDIEIISSIINLFINGKEINNDSITLFIKGYSNTITNITESIEYNYSFDEPVSIIGDFETGRIVTIQVWVNGIPQTIISNICNEVDATGKYAWSMSNIPVLAKGRVQYYFIMTDDLTNMVEGNFILKSIESRDGFMPSLNNKDNYILRI